MKYVSWVLGGGLLLAAGGAGAAFVFTLATTITADSNLVGANAVIHVALSDASLDGLATPHFGVQAVGATLGAATIHVGTSAQPLIVSHDATLYALPTLPSGTQATIDISAQIVALQGSVTVTLFNANNLAISDPSTATFVSQLPFVAVETVLPAAAYAINDSVTLTVGIKAPVVPVVYADTRLRLAATGLTITSAAAGGVALTSGEQGYVLPALDPNAPLLVTVTATITDAAASFSASVGQADGTALSEVRTQTLTAIPPSLQLEAAIESLTHTLGSKGIVGLRITSPKVTHVYESPRLQLSIKGLTLGAATLDGQPLAANPDAYVLPSFSGGETKAIQIAVEVTDLEASAEAVVVDAKGAPLSPTVSASLSSQKLGYSAGCASTGPGAWLLAAGLACLFRVRSRRWPDTPTSYRRSRASQNTARTRRLL